MNNGSKINLKSISALILALLIFRVTIIGSAGYPRFPIRGPQPSNDTLPKKIAPSAKDSAAADKPKLKTVSSDGYRTSSQDTTIINRREGQYSSTDTFSTKKTLAARDSIPVKSDSANLKRLPAGGGQAPANEVDSNLLDTAGFRPDSLGVHNDTVRLAVSKDSLDGPITYSAQDSVVLDVKTKNITLYRNATTKYKDMNLEAYRINMDNPNQLLTATYITDDSNHVVGKPKMTQQENVTESDSMRFNMKTQKGITVNTFTQSGEMFVYGAKMKKISRDEFFAFHGRFTTCNLDTPHFAFRTNKMKLINKKFAISGPVHPEFEGVPIPVYIPFGFFPISQGRHSGMLPPTFEVSPQYGLALTGLGYYKVFSDNFDAEFRANLYSYGGYTLTLSPEYRVRYRYSGRMNFVYQSTRLLDQTGKTSFTGSKTYQLNWSHTVDSKARPGQTFAANLNLMSTKFNKYVLNNPTANFNNQISSSIAYSKTWNGKYNLTVAGNHNQNNQTGLVNLNVPTIGFTAITIYPLAKKEPIGTPKWYEKLGVGLNSNITGLTSFYDSLFSLKHLTDTFQYGMQNNIPISLALPQLGPLQVSPGITLQNRFFSRKSNYTWNAGRRKVDTSYEKGLFDAENVALSMNFSTAFFGTFQNFGKNSKVLGIRHTVRPTLGFSFSPDLASGYYQNIQVDTFGHKSNLSQFSGNVYSAFSPGTFGGINFGIDNNIEMKKKSSTDTAAGANEKVKLIDGFGITGSYNYLADSFKLSTFNIYLRSTLFKKINITATTTLDPYQTRDTSGYRKDKYMWQPGPGQRFSLGRITGGSVAISTSFQSQPKDQKLADEKKQAQNSQIPMTLEEQQAELNYINTHAAEFADFNVTWQVNISYSLSFSRAIQANYTYHTVLSSSLNLNGSFNLTEKWKISMSTYYDVKNSKIQSLTTSLSRDMHCWQMSINVIPVGLYRSFSITINPKSGILRDLKLNRNRSFY